MVYRYWCAQLPGGLTNGFWISSWPGWTRWGCWPHTNTSLLDHGLSRLSPTFFFWVDPLKTWEISRSDLHLTSLIGECLWYSIMFSFWFFWDTLINETSHQLVSCLMYADIASIIMGWTTVTYPHHDHGLMGCGWWIDGHGWWRWMIDIDQPRFRVVAPVIQPHGAGIRKTSMIQLGQTTMGSTCDQP